MKLIYLFIFFVLNGFINSQVILNAYAKVTEIDGSATTLTVSNVNEVNHTFIVGGNVVVMQMQDDVIGTNTTNAVTFGDLSAIANAGNYEIRTIISRLPATGTPTSITLNSALSNVFNTGANSSVQLITLRNMGINYTTTSDITGLAWDGNVGGVIAVEVNNTLTLNHSISANAIGFRGGARSVNYYDGTTVCTSGPFTSSLSTTNAFKGEGIYKPTDINFFNGTAKILNGGGGGGMINSGGGGGSNYSAGGNGGLGWSCNATTTSRGYGGISLLSSISASRIFMGGGGGGGQQNNSGSTDGGRGGGIILLKTNTLLTNAVCGSPIRISANGQTSGNSGNDGAGGGGAAGSIVLQITNYSASATCPLSINANGGNGGNCLDGGQHAGGAGGGQGVIIFSGPQPTLNVTSTTTNGSPGSDWNGGATNATSGGGANNVGIVVDFVGPLPIELLDFKVLNQEHIVDVNWVTITEKNTNYFVVERSIDAVNWFKIKTLKAAENSHSSIYYETEDTAPLNGKISYYRLKIVDLDNSFSYSHIHAVNREEKDAFVIFYPNPSSGLINLASSYKISDIKWEMYDVTGKLLNTTIKEQTDEKIIFDFSNFSKGLYFFNVYALDGKVYKANKIIIK